MTAPTIKAAHDMGANGSPPVEAERLSFEAWMKGHCWALCATWRGTQYKSDSEVGGHLDPHAMRTRELWAAWRDRAALAFAAGQSAAGTHTDLLRRCRPIVQADAQMMADISRHAPLDPTSQATHDTTEYESEKLLPLIDAALADHIVDPNKMVGSGAELVREVESVGWHGAVCPHWWPSLRAALIAGDAAREDAERLHWLQEHTVATGLSAFVHNSGERFLVEAIDRARGGK